MQLDVAPKMAGKEPDASKRQRVLAIASDLGSFPQVGPPTLAPPNAIQSASDSDFDQADALLNARVEGVRVKSPSESNRPRIFSKKSKKHEHTAGEIFNTLKDLIDQNGSPKIGKALTEMLSLAGGDINWIPESSHSFSKRFKKQSESVPSELLQTAVQSGQLDMAKMLAPLSLQPSLDECLDLAVTEDDLATTEILLRNGANAGMLTSQFLKTVRGDKDRMVELLLRAPKPISKEALSEALAPAVKVGRLRTVLLILSMGANSSIPLSVLELAVKTSLPSITAALLVANTVCEKSALDKCIATVVCTETMTEKSYTNLELLLCAGGCGEMTNKSLIHAVKQEWTRAVKLLVDLGASIAYDSAAALKHAISRGHLELVQILLSSTADSSKEYMSATVPMVMKIADQTTRLKILWLLHSSGAKGDEISVALIDAISEEKCRLTLVKLLLQMGANINHQAGESVYKAVEMGSTEIIEILLPHNPSPTTLSRSFQKALALGNPARIGVMKLLFSAGMPVNEALHESLVSLTGEKKLDILLLKLLLENGASVAMNNYQSVVNAALSFNLPVFELLLHYVPTSRDSHESILKAVFLQKKVHVWNDTGLLIMKAILQRPHRPSAVDTVLVAVIGSSSGDPTSDGIVCQFVSLLLPFANVDFDHGFALRKASEQGRLDIVETLIKETEKCSSTTLGMAFPYLFVSKRVLQESQILVMIEQFYEKRSPPADISDHPYLTPTIFLALQRYPQSTRILEALLTVGFAVDEAFIDDKLKEKVTALLWALRRPDLVHPNIVKTLLEFQANPNSVTDKTQTTALLLATQTRQYGIMRLLIKHGANPSIANSDEITPLSHSSRTGDVTAVKILLEANPTVDDGSLQDAAQGLHLGAIELLLTANHSVHFPSPRHDGRTALFELFHSATASEDYSSAKDSLMDRTMQLLIAEGANIRAHLNGKSLLLTALDGPNPIPAVKLLLRTIMWRHIDAEFNLYTSGSGCIYSPTSYVAKGLCTAPDTSIPKLSKLLRGSGGVDRFYKLTGPQPSDMVGAPAEIKAAEERRKEQALVLAQKEEEQRLEREAKKQAYEDALDFARREHKLRMKQEAQIAEVRMEQEAQIAELKRKQEMQLAEMVQNSLQVAAALRHKLHEEALELARKEQKLKMLQEGQLAEAAQNSLKDTAALRKKLDEEATERQILADACRRRDEREFEGKMQKYRSEGRENLQAQELSHRQELERMNKKTVEQSKEGIKAEQWLIDQRRRLLESEKEHRDKVAKQEKEHHARLESQLKKQAATVRDMERVKERLVDLNWQNARGAAFYHIDEA